MAERRMFAKTIVLSDAFLDMPLSARCLYFTLGMLADDDGFVNAPRSIMRQCGASDDDMKLLISKRFVLIFDSGVIVIKHWRINNYLQKDRYRETKYLDEKAQLILDDTGNYHKSDDPEAMYTQECIHRIGKDRIGKDRIGEVNNNNPIFLSIGEKPVSENGELVENSVENSAEDYAKELREKVDASMRRIAEKVNGGGAE